VDDISFAAAAREKLQPRCAAVVALSLGGAVTMLWRPELERPGRQRRRVDGYGCGFPVRLVERNVAPDERHLSIERKSLAVFLGVVLLGLLVMPFDTGPAAGGELRMQGWHWAMLILVGVISAADQPDRPALSHPDGRESGRRHISLRAGGRGTVVLAARRRSLGLRMAWRAMIVAASLFSGKLGGGREPFGTMPLAWGNAEQVPNTSFLRNGNPVFREGMGPRFSRGCHNSPVGGQAAHANKFC